MSLGWVVMGKIATHHLKEIMVYDGPERRQEIDRRAVGGVDWFHGLPSWARVIFVVGVPSAIAIFLVYIGGKNIPQIILELAAIRNQIQSVQSTLSDIKIQNEATFRMLQRTCYNTAKSDPDRQRCFDQ
jgi:hypothetical protein